MAANLPSPQSKWVGIVLAVLAVLQGLGFTAARHASDTVSSVNNTVKKVNQCVHQLGDEADQGGECNLDEVTGLLQDTRRQVTELPGQVGGSIDQLKGQLNPEQLQRLLDLAVRRGIKIPVGPSGPPGPAGSSGPPGQPAAAAPATTTTTTPGGATTTTRPAPTTTSTRPSPSTTSTTRPCLVRPVCL